MHISEVHDYSADTPEVAKEFIRQDRKKQIKEEIKSLIEDEFDRLEEYAGEYISGVAANRAERFLERVLDGDKDAASALFDDRNGSRYVEIGYEKGKPWAQLIHGKVFETEGVRLRRQLVEANADLIKDARIKDLQSIVEGLTDQIKKLEHQLEKRMLT